MSFSENLKLIRKERNITQEQLAELLNVSRQAVSKWESGNGYPETEKLLIISKELNVSLDYLLNDKINDTDVKEKQIEEIKAYSSVTSKTITIPTYNNQNVVICHTVKSSKILFSGKDEPKYVLNGIDKVTFWGEHSVILGWYENLEDIHKEINEITEAIKKGESSYVLKYYADVDDASTFGSPKLKK